MLRPGINICSNLKMMMEAQLRTEKNLDQYIEHEDTYNAQNVGVMRCRKLGVCPDQEMTAHHARSKYRRTSEKYL